MVTRFECPLCEVVYFTCTKDDELARAYAYKHHQLSCEYLKAIKAMADDPELKDWIRVDLMSYHKLN